MLVHQLLADSPVATTSIQNLALRFEEYLLPETMNREWVSSFSKVWDLASPFLGLDDPQDVRSSVSIFRA